jgi:hypothetical protein
MHHSLIALIATVLVAAVAYAEPDEDTKPNRGHRGPPEAALEVCSSSVQGDPCSFEGRRGDSLSGNCEAHDDEALACRPEGGPPRNQLERK